MPGSTFRYGSSYNIETVYPLDFNNLPRLAATIPLPMLETTPPVTKTNFDIKYF